MKTTITHYVCKSTDGGAAESGDTRAMVVEGHLGKREKQEYSKLLRNSDCPASLIANGAWATSPPAA